MTMPHTMETLLLLMKQIFTENAQLGGKQTFEAVHTPSALKKRLVRRGAVMKRRRARGRVRKRM